MEQGCIHGSWHCIVHPVNRRAAAGGRLDAGSDVPSRQSSSFMFHDVPKREMM
jgi:hypothetical protein